MPTVYNGRRGGPPPGYPPPPQQGYGQPPMAQGYAGHGHPQQHPQQQWQGSAGVPMPPPLQNRSSMRYA